MKLRFSLVCLIAAGLFTVQANAQDRAVTTDLTAAFISGGSTASAGGHSLYFTDFESFALGDVEGQEGWAGQFGNWTIETSNPSSGVQQFRGLADGLGQSIAFSPTVAFGADDITSTSAMISLDGTGVTWMYIPQSPTAGLINTRVVFNPDGTIDVWESDGAGGLLVIPAGSAPTGYFELAVEIDGPTLAMTVSIDGSSIFSGLGFAPEIEQIVILSPMEISGPTLDMDDLAINDGPIPVEMTSFIATTNGMDVTLTWATASETNNAGFDVQVQDGESWNALGFVDGHGTTTEAQTYSYTAEDLGVGTHTFRLKQIDFDGAFEYSDELEVTVETPGTHLITSAYPNPFNPQSQFTLVVAQDQLVTAELFNTLGQRVAVLFNGTVEANQAQLVTIDGAGLASGMYVVRVTGERFSDALSVTLLK